MEYQMTIFDFLTDEQDAITNAVKHMTPYWVDSRKRIIEHYSKTGKLPVGVVKDEYCPNGFAGHYGGDFGKKGVFTLVGWDMKPTKIIFEYDPYMVEQMTWAELADIICQLIRRGEYNKEGGN